MVGREGGREGGREEGRKGAYRKENTLVENRFLITMFRERLAVFEPLIVHNPWAPSQTCQQYRATMRHSHMRRTG